MLLDVILDLKSIFFSVLSVKFLNYGISATMRSSTAEDPQYNPCGHGW